MKGAGVIIFPLLIAVIGIVFIVKWMNNEPLFNFVVVIPVTPTPTPEVTLPDYGYRVEYNKG